MSTILAFIAPNHSFTPEQLVVLGEAYDMVRKRLVPHNAPPAVLEVIASYIVTLGQSGDWKADQLAQSAMRVLLQEDRSSPPLAPSSKRPSSRPAP